MFDSGKPMPFSKYRPLKRIDAPLNWDDPIRIQRIQRALERSEFKCEPTKESLNEKMRECYIIPDEPVRDYETEREKLIQHAEEYERSATMKPNKSIIILESAMATVNNALLQVAGDRNLDEMKSLSHVLIKMSDAIIRLYNAENMADSMEKLHELTKREVEKHDSPTRNAE